MKNLKIENIQNVLDDFVKTKNASGLNLLVYKDGKEIGYWQSGLSDILNNRAYSRDTIVRLYSMTKPVTAVAAMVLLEEGKLDFANELYNYLPEFKNLKVCTSSKGKVVLSKRPVLISDLLNMTSGYSYGSLDKNASVGERLTADLIQTLNKDQDFNGPNKISTREVATRLSQIPVSFEPGSDYNYGLSADILGAVIEEISGMKFGDFLKKKIFDPLYMFDTDFYVPQEKQNRLAKVYRVTENGLELFTNCNLGIQDKMNHKPAFESGGAGLCSTVDDYMKFSLMFLNGGSYNGKKILSESTVKYLLKAKLNPYLQSRFEMKMPHLRGYSYCNLLRIAHEPGLCNVFTDNDEFGWDGWTGPYVSIDVKNKLAIVMTMQRCDSGTTAAARKVKNIIYSAIQNN